MIATSSITPRFYKLPVSQGIPHPRNLQNQIRLFINRPLRLAGFFACFTISLFWSHSNAFAQANVFGCIQEHVATRLNSTSLGVVPSNAERTIRRIAASFQMDASSIIVVECSLEASAYAHLERNDTRGIPMGEYLVYSPRWAREVVGNNPWQIVALFGHELAHFLHRDFFKPLSTRAEQERKADEFAGCAVANLGGEWSAVQDLLSRLRDEPGASDPRYPDRLKSLAAAREGFDRCARGAQPTPVEPLEIGEQEQAAFRRAEAANTISSFRTYLEAYPGGLFVAEALRGVLSRSRVIPGAPSFMVFFDWDKSALSDQAASTIRQAVEAFRSYGARNVLVLGHHDTSGPDELRRDLTVRRAQIVKAALVAQGIPESSIIAVGQGSDSLLVQTAQGVREPQNRRAEIIILR